MIVTRQRKGEKFKGRITPLIVAGARGECQGKQPDVGNAIVTVLRTIRGCLPTGEQNENGASPELRSPASGPAELPRAESRAYEFCLRMKS